MKPEYIPEIAEKVSEDGEKYLSPDEMKGDYGPGVTRRCIAIFEDIDPLCAEDQYLYDRIVTFFLLEMEIVRLFL